jgi:hypothetical protein
MLSMLGALFLILLLTAGLSAVAVGAVALCARVWRRLLPTITVAATDNRILYWPAALGIVWPLVVALLWLFLQMLVMLTFIWDNFVIITLVSAWFLLFAGLGLATMWVGSVAIACKLMIQSALARHWRMVLSTAILPLAFLPVLLNIHLLWEESVTVNEYMRFSFGYPLYLRRFEERDPTRPVFAVWADWPSDDEAVLYDETDEIAADHQSAAWKKRAKANGVICCRHRHVLGHWYYVGVDLP